jgi:hypothetical protein
MDARNNQENSASELVFSYMAETIGVTLIRELFDKADTAVQSGEGATLDLPETQDNVTITDPDTVTFRHQKWGPYVIQRARAKAILESLEPTEST